MMTLDTSSCKPLDVIKRSETLHPSTFRDRLRAAMSRHFGYRDSTLDPMARRAAHNAGNHCLRAIELMDAGNIARLARETGPMVQAYCVATDLQVIPLPVASAIMRRL